MKEEKFYLSQDGTHAISNMEYLGHPGYSLDLSKEDSPVDVDLYPTPIIITNTRTKVAYSVNKHINLARIIPLEIDKSVDFQKGDHIVVHSASETWLRTYGVDPNTLKNPFHKLKPISHEKHQSR